jgi:hypothetical protein
MANPDGNEMVMIKMMWYTFSIQRGPVEKMKEMTCEKGRRHGERKEREPPAYLVGNGPTYINEFQVS